MPVHALWQRQVERHEYGGPHDRMETHDFLSHYVHIARPILFEFFRFFAAVAERGYIVGQRVNPHVYHVLGVERNFYTPIERRARDREVAQPLVDKVVYHFLDARIGLQEIGLCEQLFYAVGILAQTEEIAFLFGIAHLAPAVGALAVHELALRPERFARLAILARIFGFVNIALFIQLGKQLGDRLFVVGVGRADKPVVADIHARPQRLNALGKPVHKRLGRRAALRRRTLHLLSVLVSARQIVHVVAVHALKARERVAAYGRIAMPYMQAAARIVYGRGNVIRLFGFGRHKELLDKK